MAPPILHSDDNDDNDVINDALLNLQILRKGHVQEEERVASPWLWYTPRVNVPRWCRFSQVREATEVAQYALHLLTLFPHVFVANALYRIVCSILTPLAGNNVSIMADTSPGMRMQRSIAIPCLPYTITLPFTCLGGGGRGGRGACCHTPSRLRSFVCELVPGDVEPPA